VGKLQGLGEWATEIEEGGDKRKNKGAGGGGAKQAEGVKASQPAQ